MKPVTGQNKKIIACFGDSITQGLPGVSYVKYLNKEVYQNHGLGGDTLTGMISRVKKYINKHTCNEFVLEIGANDILLPYLCNYSSLWNKRIQIRGKSPIVDISAFIIEYRKTLEILNSKNISIVSIPCLGENIKSELNRKVDDYNFEIKNLCNKMGIRYIDFNSWQKENISDKENPYFISKDPNDTIWDTLLTTYLGRSMSISKKRNLDITVDGVHLNNAGAKGLAVLIEGACPLAGHMPPK
jgi:lysophospholipase L1-like esterase